METLLAIDVGSSRARAKLFSRDGLELAEAACPVAFESTGLGTVEIDVERLWQDVSNLIAEIANGRAAPSGIGVTAQLGNVLVDDAGKAVCGGILWADTRALAEAEELESVAGDVFRRISGRRVTPELLAPRLMWLRHHRPDLLSRTARILSLKDYLILRFTGSALTDETHASYSGLFDVDRRCWSNELIRIAGCNPGLLPPVRPAVARAGVLAVAAGVQIGIKPGVPVAVGASDGTVGTIGAGAVRPGVTVDVAGTTDTLLHAIAAPFRDPAGAMVVNAHAAPGLWTVGGPTGFTGGAVAWMADILGLTSPQNVDGVLSQSLSAIPPGSAGLLLRPTLAGSRFPDWVPAERGTIFGIDIAHGPLHLLRAAQEGAAFTVAAAVDVMRRAGCKIDEIVVVGGLASNPLALQLRADVLGVPVLTLAKEEASSVGAAMLAGVAAGLFNELAAAAKAFVMQNRRFEPDPKCASLLRGVQSRWDSLHSVGRVAGSSDAGSL